MVLKYPGSKDRQKWSDAFSGDAELHSTDDTDSVHSEPASPAKKCRFTIIILQWPRLKIESSVLPDLNSLVGSNISTNLP